MLMPGQQTSKIIGFNELIAEPNMPTNKTDLIKHIKSLFGEETFLVPPNATNTIFVEGIPVEATEREVAHIFRPFFGFKAVRTIIRSKNKEDKFLRSDEDESSFHKNTILKK